MISILTDRLSMQGNLLRNLVKNPKLRVCRVDRPAARGYLSLLSIRFEQIHQYHRSRQRKLYQELRELFHGHAATLPPTVKPLKEQLSDFVNISANPARINYLLRHSTRYAHAPWPQQFSSGRRPELFGTHGNNFAKTMLNLARQRETLNVVADQCGTPTSAALIADVTTHIVRQYQQQKGTDFPFGLYHLVAAGETTWFDFARTVITAGQR